MLDSKSNGKPLGSVPSDPEIIARLEASLGDPNARVYPYNPRNLTPSERKRFAEQDPSPLDAVDPWLQCR